MAKSPYEVLGIAETATQDEVKKAYRTLVKSRHPDKGGTVDGFTQIQKAYELLSDKKRRSAYDVLHGIVKDSQQQRQQKSNNPFSGSIGWSSGSAQYRSSFVNAMFQQAMGAQARYMAGNSAPSGTQRQRKSFNIPRQAILQARTYQQSPFNAIGAPAVIEIEIMIDCSLFTEYPMPDDNARLEFYDHTNNLVTVDTRVVECRYSVGNGGFIEGELRVRKLGSWTTP